MTVIAQLSDTHFGTEVPEVVKALRHSLEALQPDIIIFSGDITQRARVTEFKAAASFISALPARIKFVIPGNHDIPLYNVVQRLFFPLKNYQRFLGTPQNIYKDDQVVIVGLNATSRWRHTRGKLLHRQITTLFQKACRREHTGIFIVCAHQPLAYAKSEDAENILINAMDTAQLFAESGADIVLSGHVHFPLITTSEEQYPTVHPSFVLSGAGTATSYRIRRGAPNSYNVIRIENQMKPAVSIQLIEYDKETQVFHEKEQKHFVKNAAGWSEFV